jgi:hypothetical protein
MSEVTEEVKQKENLSAEHNNVVNSVIDKIKSNNFKIYYYCPPMNTPSGGIGVIFKQAKILQEAGYNVTIIYEPRQDTKASFQESQKKSKKIEIFERFKPDWVGKDAEGIKLQPLGNSELRFNDGTTEKAEMLSINPEDFVIIPEGFPNVMERKFSFQQASRFMPSLAKHPGPMNARAGHRVTNPTSKT